MPEYKNVHEAIVGVMGEIGYVQKSRAPGLGYNYAGEAALISALRPHMVEAGLYCYVSKVRDVQGTEFTTAKGTVMQLARLTAVVCFTHAPSETSIYVEAAGEGSDTMDKSFNKAMTGAYKYALRETFCIETGDDPDATPSEERQPGNRQGSRSPASGSAPEPKPDPWAGAEEWMLAVRDQLATWGMKVSDIPEVRALKAATVVATLNAWRTAVVPAGGDPFAMLTTIARQQFMKQEPKP